MTIEKDFILSFYKEVASINDKSSIKLVQHIETKKIYVKKVISSFDIGIYKFLKGENFTGIPKIEELFVDEDQLVIVEEYISGETLSEILEKRLFSEEETISLVAQLCNILIPLHNHIPPIIHRDIKPSNLILDNSGKLYLIDFDASKRYDPEKNRDTVLIGTAEYAAPEQYGFLQSDARTDIYSIGVLICKLLSRKPVAESDYQGSLRNVIDKCTQLSPENRYTDVNQLSLALTRKSTYKGTCKASWLPPGFRTKKLSYMIAGSFWYFFLISGLLLSDPKNPKENYIDLVAIFFLYTLYFANYRGIKDVFPFRKNKNNFINLLRYILAGIIIMLVVILITSVILQPLL